MVCGEVSKLTKTNAMRQLERGGIDYIVAEYEYDESDLCGLHAALQLGMNPATVFKTLVARSGAGEPLVFCVPVDCELDLKKAAAAASCKRAELVHVKELPGLTGYVRGGCSPLAMKKQYVTFIDRSALEHAQIAVSGGRRGVQIKLEPKALARAAAAEFADLTAPTNRKV